MKPVLLYKLIQKTHAMTPGFYFIHVTCPYIFSRSYKVPP